jgi:hypothetical protein
MAVNFICCWTGVRRRRKFFFFIRCLVDLLYRVVVKCESCS